MKFDSIIESDFIKVILLGMVICFFSSLFSRLIIKPKSLNFYQLQNNISINNILKIRKFFLIYSFILFLYIGILILIFRIPVYNIQEHLSSGLAGHANLMSVISVSYIYATEKKFNIKSIFYLIISLIPLFLYGTRGWMIISILSGVFLKGYLFQKWPNKIYIILAPILGIGFMMLTYLYRNMLGEVDANSYEIFQHVIGYFISGIQGGDKLINSNVSREPYQDMVFSAIINILNILTGNSDKLVANASPNFFLINSEVGNLTNVSTAFGTLFYGLNFINGSIYLFILYIILNILFNLKIKNIYYLSYICFLSSGIFLSFFEYYLGLLFYIESIIFLFLVSFIVNNVIKVK
ncbi:O-antigen polymerase [Moraxella osloensis]|uniref:O-antigen polymerase n=1 Tax=Faucicola osloensis TaxID=34062 RepID=UPI00193425DC|nr:O-antigen polymerase [Moraxella osloensis]MBL7667629.1 oligosaccharide repeat unit polymerase [Moraxella osloensis]